jgi:hypothetical protein
MPTDRRPIDPTPVPVGTMVRWSELTDRLNEWPIDKVRARGEDLRAAQEQTDPSLVPAIERELMDAEDHELADVLILLALRSREISAYLGFPPSNNCYRIEPFCWNSLINRADSLEAIEKGVAPQIFFRFPHQTIESDLANRPLFIRKADMNAFLKLKPPSNKSLTTAAGEIAAEHKKKHGAAPMKKSDFVAKLMGRYPGCTSSRAEGVWAREVPRSWRKPGRRKRS